MNIQEEKARILANIRAQEEYDHNLRVQAKKDELRIKELRNEQKFVSVDKIMGGVKGFAQRLAQFRERQMARAGSAQLKPTDGTVKIGESKNVLGAQSLAGGLESARIRREL